MIAAIFSDAWDEEFECSFTALPVTSFVALRNGKTVGLVCYNATCRGYFGPTGIAESERGRGFGKELLMRSLFGLRELGYAYAIIGAPGLVDSYVNTLGAIPIPDSSPGIYPRKLSAN